MSLGWAASARGKGDKIAVICLLLLLGITNGAREIYPRTLAEQNPHGVLAHRVAEIARPNSLIVVSGMGASGEAEVYLPYFARQEVIALHVAWRRANGDTPTAQNRLRAKIRQAWQEKREVYLLSEVLDSPDVARAMQTRYGVSPDNIRAVFAGFGRNVAGKSGVTVVYHLTPEK